MRDLGLAHVRGVPLAVKQDEAADPQRVGLLGTTALVPGPNRLADDVEKVFAIEEHPRAVEDALASVRANSIDNVLIREGKVERHLPELKDHKLYAAILDPPPEGCGRFIINTLAKVVRPERLIYVSQNPQSFAQEAVVFEDRGYRLTSVLPVDPAPHPGAIELEAVTIGQDGVREADVLGHDETNRTLATMLAAMEPPHFPVALGVLYCDPAPSYERSVMAQIDEASRACPTATSTLSCARATPGGSRRSIGRAQG